MNALQTIFLLLGLFLASRVLAELLRVGAFRIRLKKEPPAVRISPRLLDEMRSEIVHDASKRVLRADFQRGNRS